MGDGDVARAFHEATKHTPESVMRGGRALDWDNKPHPFKVYEDELESMQLPPQLERVLVLGAGVLRKQTYGGATMFFRTYASAGALYPVEIYVVDASGVYHFDPLAKVLTRLRSGDLGAGGATHLVLTGIPWRTAWKYGDRGYRHLFWDSGTILANVLAVAAAEGLPARISLGFDDRAVARLVGADGGSEFPLCIVTFGEGELHSPKDLEPLRLKTRPLSQREERFPAIEEVHAAGVLGSDEVVSWRGSASSDGVVPLAGDVEHVIKRRGSARRFGHGAIALDVLRRVIGYGTQLVVADVDALGVRVFAAVHAVDGLEPGTYEWEPGDPLPLMRRNVRADSAFLCLGQQLGGSGAATFYLMVDLDAALDRYGDRGYRVAQLAGGLTLGRLDLAAHAAGFGATGLTFFDDTVTLFFSPAAQGLSCVVVCALGERAGRLLPLA